jgi:hypothetical protein
MRPSPDTTPGPLPSTTRADRGAADQAGSNSEKLPARCAESRVSTPEQGQFVTVRQRQCVVIGIVGDGQPTVKVQWQPDRGECHTRQGHRMRYKADLTAGSLKLRESRVIADLLLRQTDPAGWRQAVVERNVLQARSPASARRLTTLIRGRLETMGAGLWALVRDGTATVATHAALAAAVKQSPLLGDFLDLVVRDQYRSFSRMLTGAVWDAYLDDCRGRDPDMPHWSESTRRRLRSSVFQTLAQAGYLTDTKSLTLRPVHVARPVIDYLKGHDEAYVLRCLEASP